MQTWLSRQWNLMLNIKFHPQNPLSIHKVSLSLFYARTPTPCLPFCTIRGTFHKLVHPITEALFGGIPTVAADFYGRIGQPFTLPVKIRSHPTSRPYGSEGVSNRMRPAVQKVRGGAGSGTVWGQNTIKCA